MSIKKSTVCIGLLVSMLHLGCHAELLESAERESLVVNKPVVSEDPEPAELQDEYDTLVDELLDDDIIVPLDIIKSVRPPWWKEALLTAGNWLWQTKDGCARVLSRWYSRCKNIQ